MYCTSFSALNSYTRYGTYDTQSCESNNGKLTVFGHTAMSNTSRGTFGFTDCNSGSPDQLKGIDDYQDGWSCGDSWTPQSVRGERMIILVK